MMDVNSYESSIISMLPEGWLLVHSYDLSYNQTRRDHKLTPLHELPIIKSFPGSSCWITNQPLLVSVSYLLEGWFVDKERTVISLSLLWWQTVRSYLWSVGQELLNVRKRLIDSLFHTQAVIVKPECWGQRESESTAITYDPDSHAKESGVIAVTWISMERRFNHSQCE